MRYDGHCSEGITNVSYDHRSVKSKFFERTRNMFTTAAKSFVLLHYIDYKEAFSCKCQVSCTFEDSNI